MTNPSGRFAGTPIAKAFATDKTAEESGVWRDHESGISVRVRRSTLPAHKRAVRKHFRPFQHLTNMDPKDELLVKQKAAAETLVADWGVKVTVDPTEEGGKPTVIYEPLRDATGDALPPTVENVLEAFVEMPDFFQWVSEEADTFEHFRLRSVQESGGNSAPTSGGTASGGQASHSLSGGLPGASASQPSS